MAEIREAEAEIERGDYTSAEEMTRVIEERLRRESGSFVITRCDGRGSVHTPA
jgi:hypothetical protein